MLATFIEDLKTSPYYNKFILNKNVVCLYVGGSNSTGTFDSNSDFDLVAVTSLGHSFDASKEVYLKYKGRKVHWYYRPILNLFTFGADCVWLAGNMYFKNINPKLIIYINPKFQKLWDLLSQYFEPLSRLACYQLYYSHEQEINKVISAQNISAIATRKTWYHLCLATSYLLDEPVNITLLQDLKAICRRPINPINNKPALELLERGLVYVKEYPIDTVSELRKLYNSFYAQFKLLKLEEASS